MAAVMAATSIVMTVPAQAEEAHSYNGFEYSLKGSAVIITKYTGSDSSVYIPDMIDGRKVARIESGAFSGNETVEHVRFPAYLEEIEFQAFQYCTSLQEAVFPETMKYIGFNAFNGCTSISDVVFGSDVELRFSSFSGCNNIENVSLYPGENQDYNTKSYSPSNSIWYSCKGVSNVYYFGEASNQQGSFTNNFPSGTINYYALKSTDDKVSVFDPKTTHSVVTFDPNGGTGETKLYALNGQQVSEAVPPEKKDCEFIGWYVNREGTGDKWNFLTDRVSSDITLYAKYRPLQFNVTFDAQGGTSRVKSRDYSFGLAMGELPVPTRTDHTFIGWYSRPDANGELYTSSTVMPRSTVTLYAGWLQNGKSLVVNFDPNGGTCDSTKTLVEYKGQIGKLPVPEMEGNKFIGWNTSSDGTGDYFSSKTTVTRPSLTLYAIWEPKTYTVTLDPNGGKLSSKKVQAEYGSRIGKLPVPERNGYKFTGWYYKDGSKFTSSDLMPAKAVTLTAGWTGYEYMILFDARGGSVTQDTKYVVCGEKVGELREPARKGYKFLGWYTKPNGKGTKYSSKSVMPEKDVTLYASWKKVTAYATNLKLDKTKLTLGVGEKYAMTVSTTPAETIDKFTWTSSDKNVASVNSNGVITAGKMGTATVTVRTSKGKTAAVKVTVRKAPSSIKMPYSSRRMSVGQSIKITPTLEGYAVELTWVSSDPSVATVDGNGNVKALKKGNTFITAKTYNGVSAKLTLTVQ